MMYCRMWVLSYERPLTALPMRSYNGILMLAIVYRALSYVPLIKQRRGSLTCRVGIIRTLLLTYITTKSERRCEVALYLHSDFHSLYMCVYDGKFWRCVPLMFYHGSDFLVDLWCIPSLCVFILLASLTASDNDWRQKRTRLRIFYLALFLFIMRSVSYLAIES